jgi:signal peptidase I
MAAVADRRAGLTPRDRATGRRRALRRTGTALAVVLVLGVVGMVTGVLPVRIERVASGSMVPTLAIGDVVLVEPAGSRIERRDVVVVRHPDTGEELVKRVVGIGGDRVRLEDGVLLVDDEPVCEPSIDPDRIDGVFSATVTVPDGELFLLGDDRQTSVDSRDFGTVAVSDVLGLIRTRLWPSPGALPVDRCPR